MEQPRDPQGRFTETDRSTGALIVQMASAQKPSHAAIVALLKPTRPSVAAKTRQTKPSYLGLSNDELPQPYEMA
jgi:glucose dehydrogenase